MNIPEDVVQRVREEVPIFDLISPSVDLQAAGREYKGLCPFHTEKTPSFYVIPSKNIFYCHGCQEGGNPIDWKLKHEGLPFDQAVAELAAIIGIHIDLEKRDYYDRKTVQQVRARAHQLKELPELPPLDEGTKEEHEALANLRGLRVETIREAVSRRFLGFCNYSRMGLMDTVAHHRYWVITDRSGVNGQVRKMDGSTFHNHIKAITFKNAWASWPIGVTEVKKGNVILTEGGPDFLAALECILFGGLDADPICLFGASHKIHKHALPFLRNKRVLIAKHGDPAGDRAAGRWYEELTKAYALPIVVHLPMDGTDLNDLLLEETAQTVVDEWLNPAMYPEYRPRS